MALSGSLTTNKYNSDRYYKLTWSATQSIPKNTSTIKWTLSAESVSTYEDNWYAERTLILKIDGSIVYSKTDRVERKDGTIATGSKELTHKTDGSKGFSVSIEAAVYGSNVNVTGDKDFTLNDIPRYAKITAFKLASKTETTATFTWGCDVACDNLQYSLNGGGFKDVSGYPNFTITGLAANTTYSVKIRVRRKDSQLTTDSSALSVTTYNYPHCTNAPDFLIGDDVILTFYNPLNRTFDFTVIGNGVEIHTWTGRTGTTYEGVNGEPAYTNLHNSIPNSKNAKYKVKVTYGSSTIEKQGGTYSIKEDKCLPVFNNFTYKDANITVSNLLGTDQILVEGQSQVAVEISATQKMVAQKGATPVKYVATFDKLSKDIPYSTSAISDTVGTVSGSGSKRLTVTAFDSRGLPQGRVKDITVLPYAKPVINVSAKRLNNFEAQTTLSVNGTYSLLTTGGSNKNSITKVEYHYREKGGTWTSYTTLTTTLSSDKFTCNNVVLTLDNSKSYEFEVRATDKLSNNVASASVDIGQSIFHINTKTKKVYNNNKELALAEDVVALRNYIANKETSVANDMAELGLDIKNIVNVIYPVGSVYVTNTNKNPSTLLGKGTWTLTDKGFKSAHVSVTGGFTPAANVTNSGTYVDRGGNTIRVRQAVAIATALSDTGIDIGSFNWSTLGITELPMSVNDAMTYRDGANGGIVWSLYASGKVEQIDIVDSTSIASGNTFFLDFTFVVDSSRMVDSFCDKFYWKRTA